MKVFWRNTATNRFFLFLAACLSALVVGGSVTEPGNRLAGQVKDSVDFRLRAAFGRSPEISSKLKIFSFDGRAAKAAAASGLVVADFLKIIAEVKPKVILLGEGIVPAPERSRATAVFHDLQQRAVPMVIPVRWREGDCGGRKSVPWPSIPEVFLGSSNGVSAFIDAIPLLPGMLCAPRWASDLSEASFAFQGPPEAGRVPLLMRSDSVHLVPHMGLNAADMLALAPGTVRVSGKSVPLDSSGMVPLNFLPPEAVEERTRSLVDAGPTTISQGDTVIVFDDAAEDDSRIPSPHGAVPLSHSTIALANGILMGNWLLRFPHEGFMVFLSAFAALIAGMLLKPRHYLVLIPLGGAAIFLSGEVLFIFGAVQIPWLTSMTAWFAAGVPLVLGSTWRHRAEQERLRSALAWVVPPEVIRQALRRPEQMRVTPTERTITVMLVDFSGFSLVSEQLSPRIAFDELRQLLEGIVARVHAHGGVVDRATGEHLGCFFGFNPMGDVGSHDHADAAVRCGIDIQRFCVEHILSNEKSGLAAYPIRVAVNTTHAYVGDMGNVDRFDFTLLGHGCHFVRLLLGVCEPFRVVLTYSTRAHLNDATLENTGIVNRLTDLREHQDLIEIFEVDPFHSEHGRLEEATRISREFGKVSRLEERYIIPPGRTMSMATPFGIFEILNFSLSGFAARGNHYFARGVSIRIMLETPDGRLRDRLNELGLLPLYGEVRWGAPTKRGFVHGFHVTGLSEDQKRQLLAVLKSEIDSF